jgi:hypothetical protein
VIAVASLGAGRADCDACFEPTFGSSRGPSQHHTLASLVRAQTSLPWSLTATVSRRRRSGITTKGAATLPPVGVGASAVVAEPLALGGAAGRCSTFVRGFEQAAQQTAVAPTRTCFVKGSKMVRVAP